MREFNVLSLSLNHTLNDSKYFTGLFYLLILVLVLHFSNGEADATTINGDLVVDDNDQTTISSLTYVNGSVIVKDNGVLTIQSSTLQINQTTNITRTFTVSDNATVIITGSTVKSDGKLDMILSDDALLKSNQSSGLYLYNLILYDDSKARLTDTVLQFQGETALKVTLHLTRFQMIDNIDRDDDGVENNLADPYFKLKINGNQIRVPTSAHFTQISTTRPSM